MNNTYNQVNAPLSPQAMPSMIDLEDEQILLCPTIQAAFRLSFNMATVKRNDEDWAFALDTSPGNFHAILNKDLIEKKNAGQNKKNTRVRHIPDSWFELVPLLTGNNAVGQWTYLYPRMKRRAIELQALQVKQAQIAEQIEMLKAG